MNSIADVFNIKDLVREIMKHLDFYSWWSFRVASKRFLIHNKDEIIEMYNKIKYADLSHRGWINQDTQWIYILPKILIKPELKPSNIYCMARTKKLTQCNKKAIKGKYCCNIHQTEEFNFVLKNRSLDYKICSCSACEEYTITDSDFEKRIYEKNMKNKHCNYCTCVDCVCPARQQTNDYEPHALTCHWDNPCRPRCSSCQTNYS